MESGPPSSAVEDETGETGFLQFPPELFDEFLCFASPTTVAALRSASRGVYWLVEQSKRAVCVHLSSFLEVNKVLVEEFDPLRLPEYLEDLSADKTIENEGDAEKETAEVVEKTAGELQEESSSAEEQQREGQATSPPAPCADRRSEWKFFFGFLFKNKRLLGVWRKRVCVPTCIDDLRGDLVLGWLHRCSVVLALVRLTGPPPSFTPLFGADREAASVPDADSTFLSFPLRNFECDLTYWFSVRYLPTTAAPAREGSCPSGGHGMSVSPLIPGSLGFRAKERDELEEAARRTATADGLDTGYLCELMMPPPREVEKGREEKERRVEVNPEPSSSSSLSVAREISFGVSKEETGRLERLEPDKEERGIRRELNSTASTAASTIQPLRTPQQTPPQGATRDKFGVSTNPSSSSSSTRSTTKPTVRPSPLARKLFNKIHSAHIEEQSAAAVAAAARASAKGRDAPVSLSEGQNGDGSKEDRGNWKTSLAAAAEEKRVETMMNEARARQRWVQETAENLNCERLTVAGSHPPTLFTCKTALPRVDELCWVPPPSLALPPAEGGGEGSRSQSMTAQTPVQLIIPGSSPSPPDASSSSSTRAEGAGEREGRDTRTDTAGFPFLDRLPILMAGGDRDRGAAEEAEGLAQLITLHAAQEGIRSRRPSRHLGNPFGVVRLGGLRLLSPSSEGDRGAWGEPLPDAPSASSGLSFPGAVHRGDSGLSLPGTVHRGDSGLSLGSGGGASASSQAKAAKGGGVSVSVSGGKREGGGKGPSRRGGRQERERGRGAGGRWSTTDEYWTRERLLCAYNSVSNVNSTLQGSGGGDPWTIDSLRNRFAHRLSHLPTLSQARPSGRDREEEGRQKRLSASDMKAEGVYRRGNRIGEAGGASSSSSSSSSTGGWLISRLTGIFSSKGSPDEGGAVGPTERNGGGEARTFSGGTGREGLGFPSAASDASSKEEEQEEAAPSSGSDSDEDEWEARVRAGRPRLVGRSQRGPDRDRDTHRETASGGSPFSEELDRYRNEFLHSVFTWDNENVQHSAQELFSWDLSNRVAGRGLGTLREGAGGRLGGGSSDDVILEVFTSFDDPGKFLPWMPRTGTALVLAMGHRMRSLATGNLSLGWTLSAGRGGEGRESAEGGDHRDSRDWRDIPLPERAIACACEGLLSFQRLPVEEAEDFAHAAPPFFVSEPLTSVSPFVGLWAADFGPHGGEFLWIDGNNHRLSCRKVTGDPNVPASAYSFFANLNRRLTGQESRFLDLVEREQQQAGAEERDRERLQQAGAPRGLIQRDGWGPLLVCEGKGRIAQHMYEGSQWTPLEVVLLENSGELAIFWIELRSVMLLKRVTLDCIQRAINRQRRRSAPAVKKGGKGGGGGGGGGEETG
uniref:Uncharacterized protein n=1 Tax=Chromera velia CCMP2878 TaxID=1169474 RepID=A0A0G4HER4_9ALVE|eukprot:Cvel_26856.t1-p1 / transcript=Cvel_26856.t1 / gene=Cvel_26856 / organism=Chromera_velia_CCMP2878 / gene_product=hypothetical protein / transcript_product=hypothetical protein / location=Cvel_scaffold3258:1460-9156(-) / protein_length=1373 / sequence_SO=supercontig / SO=protein_coding / is_pseudo=false